MWHRHRSRGPASAIRHLVKQPVILACGDCPAEIIAGTEAAGIPDLHRHYVDRHPGKVTQWRVYV